MLKHLSLSRPLIASSGRSADFEEIGCFTDKGGAERIKTNLIVSSEMTVEVWACPGLATISHGNYCSLIYICIFDLG